MSYALAVRPRRPVVLALSLLLAAGPATPAFAQGNCSGGVSASPPVDNREGYFVNLEEAPIHPLEFGSNGHLWQANLPDARIVVWNLTTPLAPRKLDEIGVGLGPVSIRLRPAVGASPREVWVACQSSNAVFVIDEATRKVTKTVRLKGEPTDIAFDASNRFAYVSLAAANRIAKVDANTLAVLSPLVYDSDYPPGGTARGEVEEPRAMMRDGNSLFVLSHLSGNGTQPTTADLIDPPIANAWQFGLIPPDRDVLAFDLSAGTPTGLTALWRMGTLNFDLVKADDGRTYVSTVDFANQTVAPAGGATLEGEFDYKAKGFGRHLIAHAVAGINGFPQPGTLAIDLNVDVDPLLPASFRCAVPTDIAYDSVAERLFVACYETRNVAVVQLNSTASGGTVIAELLAAPVALPNPAAFGPRGVALSANGLTAYVLYRGDHKLQAFDLTGLGAGSRIAPSAAGALSAGFDITPLRILNGRRHFLNAANSGTGTATCNTCHMDGHLDGIGWDLSDFTGKLDSTPGPEKIGREPKGTKVTMSLRGIEETPPFHWRGDRADLDAFNPAFSGLLGGAMLGPTPLREFEDFVFSLSYPANPNLADNRGYSLTAKDGFDCYSTHKTMHTVLHDMTGGPPPTGNPNGNLDISCAGCHSMDGASGTLNQVNNPFPPGIAPLGDDATQLRGLWDKESQTVAGLLSPTDRMPATGWGFANTGVVDSVIDFINIGVFNHMGHDLQIERFLKEMDTGVAPTAAFAVLLSGGATTADETLLTSALAAPQPLPAIANGAANFPAHDLIARGWVRLVGGGPQVSFGMLWDGARFLTDRTGTTFTLAALKAKVAAGDAAVALIGVPVGSGYRLGLDRDLDFRLDGDEVSIAPFSATESADTDGDTFPDGYETRLGSNPALAASLPPVETVPPQVLTNKIAWINSNVVKARWSTDEESTTRLRVWKIGPGPLSQVVYDREDGRFKKYHSAVGRKLAPGGNYRVEAITKDPRGNTQTVVLNAGVPSQPFLFLSTQAAKTTLARTGPGTVAGTQAYQAVAAIVDETGAPIADGAMVSGTLVEWDAAACAFTPGVTPPGTCSTVSAVPAIGTVGGIATFNIQGTRNFAVGTAEFFVTGVVDNTPSSPNPGLARIYFKPLSGQFGFWGQTSVP